ncbi:UNVERIFIED_CONTAM: hypothetical protein GTU68_034488, partial [Idotea baltica]|nr:hypothetical protein [Idotea baltica]
MAILKITNYPEPILRERAEEVETFDAELAQLLSDMAETMYDAPGIGLAGPQVAELKRITVIDVGEGGPGLLKLVNPRIVESEGKVVSDEGCLSIPGIHESVNRFEKVLVEAQDENGEELSIEADGLLGICLQHEIDHLDGILFIDYLSQLKKQLIKKKLRRME